VKKERLIRFFEKQFEEEGEELKNAIANKSNETQKRVGYHGTAICIKASQLPPVLIDVVSSLEEKE
jgi:hypothetical protein